LALEGSGDVVGDCWKMKMSSLLVVSESVVPDEIPEAVVLRDLSLSDAASTRIVRRSPK
jgi:hypothetical protein